MNNYQYLYEDTQRQSFANQIYGGHLNESQIQNLINENRLDETQIKIAEGILGRTFDRTKGFLGSRSEPKGYERDYEREKIKGSSTLRRHRAVLQRALDDYLNDLRILDIATPEIEESIRNMKSEIDRHVMDSTTGGTPTQSYSSSDRPLASQVSGQWAQGPKGRFVPRKGSVVPPR